MENNWATHQGYAEIISWMTGSSTCAIKMFGEFGKWKHLMDMRKGDPKLSFIIAPFKIRRNSFTYQLQQRHLDTFTYTLDSVLMRKCHVFAIGK